MTSVAIAVPTYNRADLIEPTIDSLLAQSRPADEIIVVDDGSTDDTQAVLSRYKSHLRVIRLPNGGELIARNTALRESTCDLLAFCDSDDIWETDCLHCLAAQWEMTPDLFAAYCDFRILRATRLSSNSKFADAPAGFWSDLEAVSNEDGVFRVPFADKLLDFQPFFPSCMMVHRARFLASGGWDEAVTGIVGCDFATALRVAMRPPVGIVRRPLVQVRKHAQNFSANTERMNLGDSDILAHVLQTRPELVPLARAVLASMAKRRGQAMESAFSRLDFAETCRIAGMLSWRSMTPKQRVKLAIAHFPAPLARFAATTLARN